MLYFSKLKKWKAPESAAPYLDLIAQQEKENGLPHNLLARLLEQESHFDPLAHNTRTDAQGIAQIVPRWHPDIVDPFNPDEAIPYAARYLRKLYDNFGHWDLALAAYNWGWGHLRNLMSEHGNDGFDYMPRETRHYVAEILGDI